MLQEIQRVFQIPELKSKISLLCCCWRLAALEALFQFRESMAKSLSAFFRHATGGGQNLFQMVDIFSGGAFSQMTVIALGVVPYISASIIMQLLVALWPSLQREVRENREPGKA